LEKQIQISDKAHSMNMELKSYINAISQSEKLLQELTDKNLKLEQELKQQKSWKSLFESFKLLENQIENENSYLIKELMNENSFLQNVASQFSEQFTKIVKEKHEQTLLLNKYAIAIKELEGQVVFSL
jgi:hypothetical protein